MHELTASPSDSPEESAKSAADSTAGSKAGPSARRAQSRQRARGRILSEEQCLASLSQLPGLVSLGVITPAQANAMRGVFTALLAHYAAPREPANGAGASASILAAIRKDSSLLNLLGPLLSDEQFDAIVQEVTGDGHEQT